MERCTNYDMGNSAVIGGSPGNFAPLTIENLQLNNDKMAACKSEDTPSIMSVDMFKIVGEIIRTNSSIGYRAKITATNEIVLLLELRDHNLNKRTLASQIESINNIPNILPIRSHFFEGDTFYAVLDYPYGMEPLSETLRKRPLRRDDGISALNSSEVTYLAIQLLDTLGYQHHRDRSMGLCVDNILCNATEFFNEIKILPSFDNLTIETRSESKHCNELDDDIYSLGRVLLQCATGFQLVTSFQPFANKTQKFDCKTFASNKQSILFQKLIPFIKKLIMKCLNNEIMNVNEILSSESFEDLKSTFVDLLELTAAKVIKVRRNNSVEVESITTHLKEMNQRGDSKEEYDTEFWLQQYKHN